MKTITSLTLLCAATLASFAFQGVPLSAQPAALDASAAQAAPAFTPFPGAVSPDTVNSSMLGSDVVLDGVIKKTVASERDNVPNQLFLVESETAPVMIVYWKDAADAIHPGAPPPAAGTRVSVTGKLEEYRGALQVRVRAPEQIRIAGMAAPAAPVAAAAPAAPSVTPDKNGYFHAKDLDGLKTMVGRELSIAGKVDSFRASWSETAPNVITLAEDGKTMEVVFWPEPGQSVPDFSAPGTEVYASGLLQQYREKIQLKIDDVANLSNKPLPADRIMVPAPKPAAGSSAKDGWPGKTGGFKPAKGQKAEIAPGTPVSLRDINPSLVGKTVAVSGKIGGMRDSESSRSVVLRDDTGFIRVNLPVDYTTETKVGDRMAVLGKVVYNEVRGALELELVPGEAPTGGAKP